MRYYKDYSKFNQINSFGTFITRNPHHVPWYQAWYNAKQRCLNPKNPSYQYYGEKGIKFFITINEVKQLWFRDKAYLMDKPSIDRIDNDESYIFENCRFIELSENVRKSHIERKKK